MIGEYRRKREARIARYWDWVYFCLFILFIIIAGAL